MNASRAEEVPLLERLCAEPHRFEFHQALRLLVLLRRRGGVGEDADPAAETVRLRGQASLRFPTGGLRARQRAAADGATPEFVATFFGLVGPDGALPDPYTELVLRRARARDPALAAFLDLFQHRTLCLLHRAWEKYRLAAAFEDGAKAGRDDPISAALHAIVGHGSPSLRGRLDVHDDVFVSFAGHFARRTRPAGSLAAILSDYFDLPVEVEQFRGEWLTLPLPERTRLPSDVEPRGNMNRLGGDAILGRHAFDVQGGFRLRVGPIRYADFRRLMPTGDLLGPMCRLARAYVGLEYDFDVRPVLVAGEAPRHRLGYAEADAPRLGWNTWLLARPATREFSGVSFTLDPRRAASLEGDVSQRPPTKGRTPWSP